MRHVGEEDLVLHHYGEARPADGIEAHLAECQACRRELERLRRALAAIQVEPPPARGADYGARVWERLEPRLARAHSQPRLGRGWLAAALAASLLIAFLLVRTTAPPSQLSLVEPSGWRERILLLDVSDHLERSRMVLVELANASGDDELDISAERSLAAGLVGANRLYRQTAARAGEAGVASLLDDLERVLLEVAHGPEQLSPFELAELQERLASRGILFKLRVTGSQVRDRHGRRGRAAGELSS